MKADLELCPPLAFLSFTYPFNIMGQPTAMIPCGWNEDDIPVALQIIGRHLDDGNGLCSATVFE